MKFLLIFLLLSGYVQAQQVTVFLIGTAHHYRSDQPQDFAGIHAKIKRFAPTAFFGEFVSSEAERHLMDYWCKQDNRQRLQTLRNNRNIAPQQLAPTIERLAKAARKTPANMRVKTDLAHAYYLNQDVANAHYQFWQVYTHLLQTPDTALQQYMNTLLRPEWDTTGRSMKRLKTSEYAALAFPVMQELKIETLHAMDCQDYDLNWTAAAMAFHTKFETLVHDSSATKNRFQPGLAKRMAGFETYARYEKDTTHLTEWLNTDAAAEILASGDFYDPEMYTLEGFPKEEMEAQLHWWWMRNKQMCANVINGVRTLGAKKVVVIVGANHRRYMQQVFATMPGVTVLNINQAQ